MQSPCSDSDMLRRLINCCIIIIIIILEAPVEGQSVNEISLHRSLFHYPFVRLCDHNTLIFYLRLFILKTPTYI